MQHLFLSIGGLLGCQEGMLGSIDGDYFIIYIKILVHTQLLSSKIQCMHVIIIGIHTIVKNMKLWHSKLLQQALKRNLFMFLIISHFYVLFNTYQFLYFRKGMLTFFQLNNLITICYLSSTTI